MTTTQVARRHAAPDEPGRAAPLAVRVSFMFWLGAIGAALLEMAGAVSGALADGTISGTALAVNVVIRLVVFAAAVAVMIQMRRGRRWARVVLAVVLGVFGTASLVYGPVGWLLAGNSVPALLASADAGFVFTAVARVLHLAGVAGGVIAMFLPAANRYFGDGRRRIHVPAHIEQVHHEPL